MIDDLIFIMLPLQVKFLIPNVAAGSIIGKAGAHISEIQTQSGARMQVCRDLFNLIKQDAANFLP